MRQQSLRRIVISVIGTVSGVVLLLALKPDVAPTPSAQGVPDNAASATQPSQRPEGNTAPGQPSQQGQQGEATRTVTGDTVRTDYGPVQVRITLAGGRITAASAIQAPSTPGRSQQLSATAIPQLNQRAVAAQSADIDAVSGATYTSQGYIASLQSALDAAGV